MSREEATKEIENNIHKLENSNFEENKEPLGIRLTKAKMDITMAILQVQSLYVLPAYLTDLVVSACLSDIRDCANKDLLDFLLQRKSDQKEETK